MSDDDSDEMYSMTSSQTVYKRTRSRTSSVDISSVPEIRITSDSDERLESDIYLPVQKWAVDYNNKNYVRSLCNKNIGSHRKIKGRPLDWHIEYDNNYHTRSKVNAPKGLHRRIPEVKRKYAPDKDDLADATGWEFDCGPEYDQKEQDVPYIPEGKIIRRGCYRWYGVKRNDSDCDIKEEEHRENLLTEGLKRELKCGHEFLQSDVPHLKMSEEKDHKYTRGAYRHYEVQRNAYDILPEELASASTDPEWKRKHHSNGTHYLDLGMCKYDRDDLRERYGTTKGKPFRRTILNKVYELKKERDPRDSQPRRRRTQIHLVPGEGERTEYHGVPDRYPFKTKRTPSIRSVFKKKAERKRYRSSKEGEEFEEYEREESERSYREELGQEYQDRLHGMADRKRGQLRRSSYDEEYRDSDEMKSGSSRGRFKEYAYRVKSEGRHAPRRLSMATSKRSDDTEKFQAWSDNVINTKREQMQRDKLRTRRESYRDDNHYPRDTVVVKRSNKSKDLDYSDHHLQSRRSIADHDYDHHSHSSKGSHRSIRYNKADFEDTDSERNEPSKKPPPHVEERMKKIRQKMHEKFEDIDHEYREQGDSQVFEIRGNEEDIDLIQHKRHPKDRGQTHDSEYEKYVTKNGSVLWIKKEEKYTELHHKDY